MAPFEHWKPAAANARAHEELEHISGHHTEDLFGEEAIDPQTGKPFAHEHLKGIDDVDDLPVTEPGETDALPALKEEEDAATKWLRENDPTFKAKKKPTSH